MPRRYATLKKENAMKKVRRKKDPKKAPLYLCKNCGRHHWDGPKDCPMP